MRSEEFSAKTVEEALKSALDSFGLETDDVTYEILEQPTKGFLGFGGKNARIKVTEKYSAERVGVGFLKQVFADMELNAEVKVTKKDEYFLFEIIGENLGILIGRRGDTLDALQFLLNLVLNKESEEKVKGILDVENYREKREETLEHLGIKLAERARRTGQRVVLEPMNPQERRIIHMVLQDDKTVTMTTEYPGTMVLCYEQSEGGKSGLMKNVNIRKAISYSINREEMVSAVYGRYTAAYGFVSPAITLDGTSYRKQASETMKEEYEQYAGDADKLKALFQKGLDELGITDKPEDITMEWLWYN